MEKVHGVQGLFAPTVLAAPGEEQSPENGTLARAIFFTHANAL
jgi:hypothetical protein